MDLRRLLFGLLLIAIGGVLILQRADIIEDFSIWQLWPLILVGLGLVMLSERRGSPLGGIILIILGGVFLIGNVLPGSAWNWFWPLLLVGLGVWILTQRDTVVSYTHHRRDRGGGMNVVSEDVFSRVTILQGVKVRNTSTQLRGGSLVTVLGELEMSLRDTVLADHDATLDITNILGETEVLLPSGWNVRVNATAVLGEVNDRTVRINEQVSGAPALIIRATAILGEITIRQ